MTVPAPKILDALMRHDRVKALVLIDEKGNPLATRGQARSLVAGANEATVVTDLSKVAADARECVYITRHGLHHFLVVIFDENVDFDTLKKDVDATIAQHKG